MQIKDLDALNQVRRNGLKKLQPPCPRISVGMGTCGIGNGAENVHQALLAAVDARGAEIDIVRVGCFGCCSQETLVNIVIPGKPLVMLNKVEAAEADSIVEHALKGTVPEGRAFCKIESWDHRTGVVDYGFGFQGVRSWDELPFYKCQKKIVLRNCGLINPDDIEEFIAVGGYRALLKALRNMDPGQVIEEVRLAKLRGRGGAGFFTATKWSSMQASSDPQRYIVCNADEGDPGAYMNRNEIESDPHSLIEGMIIGAYATGATQGVIYVRAEYPLAVRSLEKATAAAREVGLLGENILGSDFSFDLSVVEGAGAFVCGEETALIASLEGMPGRPRPRPPYPAEKGLWEHPTNINNVETWFNIPVIIANGNDWFRATGTENSPGTKVFSLVGKVRNTGLVEMPLGTPIKTFVYDAGGGAANGKSVKSVQTGGPSGGCIPVEMFESPVDYESLASLGSIMGSGGMVVMDDDNCMVDIAMFFAEFTNNESCGKCVPCRVGLSHVLRILENITCGRGTMDDLRVLEDLSGLIRDTSLCGLGQTAPNPVMTTLRYFRHEYEDHIQEGRCAAGVCADLFLSPCENSCPLHMNIPRFIQLFKEDRLEEAFESVIFDNPLPASTGRVCQHPCDDRCRRASVDSAVNMREIHRFIADSAYDTPIAERVLERLKARMLPASGKRVAVVGAGPTGLTAAYYLALLGHGVTVFDENSEAGGMLRFALPEYRLPKEVVRKEIAFIEALGVNFEFNTRIGVHRMPKDLAREYDAVFLGLGTWEGSRIDLPGGDCNGVFHALRFLDNVAKGESHMLGRRVVVIGGGNAAVDSARTCRRLGADVTVVYRRQRQDMPAIAEEVNEAEEEGVGFQFLSAPHRIIGDSQYNVTAIEVVRTVLDEFTASGRRQPVLTDEVTRISCDTVILAIGEHVDTAFTENAGLVLNRDGTIRVQAHTRETSLAGIFAGGDAVTGASNLSNAMSQGKRAALMIDVKLSGENRFNSISPQFVHQNTIPETPGGGTRNISSTLPAKQRNDNFEEVMLGYSERQANEECERCLRCDVKVV